MLLFFVSFFNHASPLPEILFIKCRCELHNKKKPPLPLTSFTTTEEDKWKACGILPEVGFNRNLESWIPNPISFPRNLAWRGREGGQGEHSKKQVWSSSTHAAYDVTVFHPLQHPNTLPRGTAPLHFHDCNGSIEAPDTKLYPSSIPFPHVRCHERRGDGHWPLFNCYHHHRYQVCTKIQFLSSRCNLKILRSKGMLGISFWKHILDVDGEQDTEKKNQGKVTLQSAKFLVLV